MKLECKLRMQLCAILSQLHRHKEALDQAYAGSKLGNLVIKDQQYLCQYISKRVDFEKINKANGGKSNLQTEESAQVPMMDSSFSDDDALEEGSVDSVGEYQTHQAHINNLEESISLVERSAKKLLPIYKELHRRLVQFKQDPKKNINKNLIEEDLDSDFDRQDSESNPEKTRSA